MGDGPDLGCLALLSAWRLVEYSASHNAWLDVGPAEPSAAEQVSDELETLPERARDPVLACRTRVEHGAVHSYWLEVVDPSP